MRIADYGCMMIVGGVLIPLQTGPGSIQNTAIPIRTATLLLPPIDIDLLDSEEWRGRYTGALYSSGALQVPSVTVSKPV